MDWLTVVLNAPITRDGGVLVLAFVLVYVIDKRLTEMVQSSVRTEEMIRNAVELQAARMSEIRGDIRNIAQQLGRLSRDK